MVLNALLTFFQMLYVNYYPMKTFYSAALGYSVRLNYFTDWVAVSRKERVRKEEDRCLCKGLTYLYSPKGKHLRFDLHLMSLSNYVLRNCVGHVDSRNLVIKVGVHNFPANFFQ